MKEFSTSKSPSDHSLDEHAFHLLLLFLLGEWWHDRFAAPLLYREAEAPLQSEKNAPNN